MKEKIISIWLTLCLSVVYSSLEAQSEEIDCLRRINRQISAKLEKKLESSYDLIKGEIRFIMKFYIKESGMLDSIIIAKSNLSNFGIKDEQIKNKLSKKKYKCLWDVYYSKRLKPDYVTVVFNPKIT